MRDIIVKYGNTTQEQAKKLLKQSAVYKTVLDSYLGVALTAHNLEYHWGMLIVHGEVHDLAKENLVFEE